MVEQMDDKSEIIEMTADIVSAYVGNNTVATADLPNLIQSIHRALTGVAAVPRYVHVHAAPLELVASTRGACATSPSAWRG